MKELESIVLCLRSVDITTISPINQDIDNNFGSIFLRSIYIWKNVPIRRILSYLYDKYDYFTITLNCYFQNTELVYNYPSMIMLDGLNFLNSKNNVLPNRNLQYKTSNYPNPNSCYLGSYQDVITYVPFEDTPFTESINNKIQDNHPVVFSKPTSDIIDLRIDLIIDDLLSNLSNDAYYNFTPSFSSLIFTIRPVVVDFKLYKQLKFNNILSSELILRTWEINDVISNSINPYIFSSLGEFYIGQRITWRNINLRNILGAIYDKFNKFNLVLTNVIHSSPTTTYSDQPSVRSICFTMEGIDFICFNANRKNFIGINQLSITTTRSESIETYNNRNTFYKKEICDITIELFNNSDSNITSFINSNTIQYANSRNPPSILYEKIPAYQSLMHQTYAFKIYPVIEE
jgi:hypothetical protein